MRMGWKKQGIVSDVTFYHGISGLGGSGLRFGIKFALIKYNGKPFAKPKR